jgi:hypothetical protein
MELSNVLLLTKAACGPLCRRYARPVGLKVKTAALFTMGPTTQRMPSKKTARMGDEGKAVGFVPPTALLFERRSSHLTKRRGSWCYSFNLV